jgi:hypothetical protein
MSNPSLTLGELSSKIRHVETVLFPHTTAKLRMEFFDGIWYVSVEIFDKAKGRGVSFEGFGLWLDVAAKALFNRLDSLTTKDFPQ